MQVISTPDELLTLMGSGTISGNYTLLDNIDMSDYTILSIDEFQGVFDGNGYTITIKNTDSNYVGLFKLVSGSSSTIQNLTVVYTGTQISNTNSVQYNSLFIAEINVTNNYLIDNCHLQILNDFSVSVNTTTAEGAYGSFLGVTFISSLSSFPSTPNINNCSFTAYGDFTLTDTGTDRTSGIFGGLNTSNVTNVTCIFNKDFNMVSSTEVNTIYTGYTNSSQITDSFILCKGNVSIQKSNDTVNIGCICSEIQLSNFDNVNCVINGNLEYTNSNDVTFAYLGCYCSNLSLSTMNNCNLIIHKQTLINIPNLVPSEDVVIGAFSGYIISDSETTASITNCTLLFGTDTTIPGAEFIDDKYDNSIITNCSAIYKDYNLSTLTGYGTCLSLGANSGSSPNLPTNTLSDIQTSWNSLPATSWFNSLSNLRYSFNPEVTPDQDIVQIYSNISTFKIYSILNSMLYANIENVPIKTNLNLFTTQSISGFLYVGYDQTNNLEYNLIPYLSNPFQKQEYLYLPTNYGVMNVPNSKTLTYQTSSSSVIINSESYQQGDLYDGLFNLSDIKESLLLETLYKPEPYVKSSNYNILNIILCVIISVLVVITVVLFIISIFSIVAIRYRE